MPYTKTILEHLSKHQTFPASKDDIIAMFAELHGIEGEEIIWLQERLPDAVYDSSDEVKEELGISA